MFMHCADSAFNYSLLGAAAFAALVNLIDVSECYAFAYSKLDDAVDVFERLQKPCQS